MNLATALLNSARTFGDRPAISVGDELALSYAQLHLRAVKLAAGLRSIAGVEPGDRVALVMSNCAEYLEVLYAIWHAGLVAVPINAKLHAREVEFILCDCAVSVCLVTDDRVEAITAVATSIPAMKRVICVGTSDYANLVAEPMAQAEAGRDDLAWIFYTSGTTGKPKGAMLTHQNLQLMSWSYLCDFDFLTEEDCLIHTGPQSHAAGLLALTHVAKASHHILPASGGFDPGEICSLIDTNPRTTIFAAPTMLRRLLDSAQVRTFRSGNLRSILLGAAPVYPHDIKRALGAFGPVFSNGYGQGECPCTISAMAKHMYALDMDEERMLSVGIARTGVEVRVFDADDREVPCGEVGEIAVRSDIVMKGYWNQPQASSRTLANGWLHTGDLGAMDSRGFLSLKDRSKDLIISGGSNIYPLEVEEVLLRSGAISEVAVVGRPDPQWGESVVAFVVARPGVDPPSTEALDSLCLEYLARYKRPKEYVFVRELPRNSTGKVLKTELRQRLKPVQD
jgi:long-chain acyl-CoA synthetase